MGVGIPSNQAAQYWSAPQRRAGAKRCPRGKSRSPHLGFEQMAGLRLGPSWVGILNSPGPRVNTRHCLVRRSNPRSGGHKPTQTAPTPRLLKTIAPQHHWVSYTQNAMPRCQWTRRYVIQAPTCKYFYSNLTNKPRQNIRSGVFEEGYNMIQISAT